MAQHGSKTRRWQTPSSLGGQSPNSKNNKHVALQRDVHGQTANMDMAPLINLILPRNTDGHLPKSGTWGGGL